MEVAPFPLWGGDETGRSDGMKPSQVPWKWLLFCLLAVLAFGIALIPKLIGDTSRFEDRVAAELSSWIGGEVKFIGPVRVTFFPDVSVRGQLEVQDSTRLPSVQTLTVGEAKVSLDLVDLLRGTIAIDALRLLKPRITLRDGPTAGVSQAQAPQALFTNLLSGAPMRVLDVRAGRIALGPRGSSIKEIYAHLDAGKDTGAISGFGAFTYKDTTVRYSLETGAPTNVGVVESFPLTLTLTSKSIRARLNGTASYASELKLDGDMQAETDDARKFLKWVGLSLPAGDSLKGFSAAGAFHVTGPTLTFDDGTFTLDGNKAVGLLALTATGSRPRVEGTLAFDRLLLDPYLGKTDQTESKQASLSSTAALPFGGLLLQSIDADLRISAAAIDAGALKLGRGGFTVTAKKGVVASEVGELGLCGGSADGRLNVDLAQAPPQVNVVANLTDVSMDTCLKPLGLAVAIRGTGRLKTELATEGNDLAQLTDNLTGTLKIDAEDGVVPIDFAHLLTGRAPLNGEGWSHDSVTAFDQLDADCRLSPGHIWCQSLSMRTPQGNISGAGGVDLTTQTLDWNLTVANPIIPARASQLTQEGVPSVSIRGSLSQPMIRRADRPTLGEGGLQTSPAGTQVLPH
jgi:AsmA protein